MKKLVIVCTLLFVAVNTLLAEPTVGVKIQNALNLGTDFSEGLSQSLEGYETGGYKIRQPLNFRLGLSGFYRRNFFQKNLRYLPKMGIQLELGVLLEHGKSYFLTKDDFKCKVEYSCSIFELPVLATFGMEFDVGTKPVELTLMLGPVVSFPIGNVTRTERIDGEKYTYAMNLDTFATIGAIGGVSVAFEISGSKALIELRYKNDFNKTEFTVYNDITESMTMRNLSLCIGLQRKYD